MLIMFLSLLRATLRASIARQKGISAPTTAAVQQGFRKVSRD